MRFLIQEPNSVGIYIPRLVISCYVCSEWNFRTRDAPRSTVLALFWDLIHVSFQNTYTNCYFLLFFFTLIIFWENYYSKKQARICNFSACAFSPYSIGFYSEFCTCDSIGAAREEYYSNHIKRNRSVWTKWIDVKTWESGRNIKLLTG